MLGDNSTLEIQMFRILRCFRLSGVGVVLVLTALRPLGAQSASGVYVNPCDTSPYDQFDFWVGEWQVVDFETNELVGIDDVTKDFEGCVVIQRWRQMNDRYRPRNAPFRLRGMSINGILPDRKWQQTWVDNTGFAVTLAGTMQGDTMILESRPYTISNQGNSIEVQHRWHWKPLPDGTVHSWGMQRAGGDWQTTWNILYRANR